MNDFDLLLIVNVAILGVALVRSRPGALIIAANLATALRSLSNIVNFGQPSSESFIPFSVFSPRNVDIAGVLFLIATAWLGVSVLVGSSNAGRTTPTFPPLPRWLLVALGLICVAETLSSGSLATEAYQNTSGTILGFSLGGANPLIWSLILYEIARRTLIKAWRPSTGFLVLSTILFLVSFSKGSTGLATGYEVAAIVLLWRNVDSLRMRLLASVTLIAATVFGVYLLRGIRTTFFERGTGAVSEVLEAGSEIEASRQTTGEGIERSGNGTQYASHTLECINLYEAGNSREWRSVYYPIIYTFEPAPLLDVLKVTRPQEAAWELADYYNHGGGIYILGELYWNGGYLCVFVVFGLLVLLTFYCDTRFHSSAFWLMMCCQFVPSFLMGAGYGFAQVSRGAFNDLLVMLAYWLSLQRKFRWRRADHDPRLPRSFVAKYVPPTGQLAGK